uniref:Uncharacterized protein n=1 Tax=Timema douglasi TaxID=61478 RepID=A0A7R8Z426_TIMDO|nr:unnamed protein product [Timema douglasi]
MVRNSAIKVEGKNLRRSQMVRYLEVTLDENRNFTAHIEEVIGRAQRIMDKIISIGRRHTTTWSFSLLLAMERKRWEDSETGRRAYQLFPDVVESIDNIHMEHSPGLVQFITRKGLYPESLRKMGLVESDLCGCGEVGTPEHVVLEYKLAAEASERAKIDYIRALRERRGLIQRLNRWRAKEGRGERPETVTKTETMTRTMKDKRTETREAGLRRTNKERCREVANTKPCGTGIPVRLMDPEAYWGNPGNYEGSSFQPNNGKDEGEKTRRMGEPYPSRMLAPCRRLWRLWPLLLSCSLLFVLFLQWSGRDENTTQDSDREDWVSVRARFGSTTDTFVSDPQGQD